MHSKTVECGGKKRSLDTLELELLVVVNCEYWELNSGPL